jgi:hypothetical protein
MVKGAHKTISRKSATGREKEREKEFVDETENTQ